MHPRAWYRTFCVSNRDKPIAHAIQSVCALEVIEKFQRGINAAEDQVTLRPTVDDAEQTALRAVNLLKISIGLSDVR